MRCAEEGDQPIRIIFAQCSTSSLRASEIQMPENLPPPGAVRGARLYIESRPAVGVISWLTEA
jgi:hypothetical protein